TSRVLTFPTEVRYPVDFRVSAQVLSFEGEAGGQAAGEALLKVRWTILDGIREQVVVVEESSYRSRLNAPGDQEALVAAMSETLGAFSRDVAERLRGLPRPVPLPVETP
ncbi:MAG TPA: ABC-type transport auxiliary lipoprotein family protein, partial [Chromatiaceae bacterium]|nr:ABC-type transport auxiliary lipoprotein family protein [Chromatiaceae bacterium]